MSINQAFGHVEGIEYTFGPYKGEGDPECAKLVKGLLLEAEARGLTLEYRYVKEGGFVAYTFKRVDHKAK